jgi:hypothetical protein
MMTVKEQKRTEIENVMIKYYLALGLNSSVSITVLLKRKRSDDFRAFWASSFA